MINSRKISDLNPHVQPHAIEFLQKCRESGLDVIVTSTLRDQEFQDDIYAQGRSKPGKIVTWTHSSKHISGNALDFAVVKNGKATWDIKADTDEDNIADYFEAGAIAQRLGWTWGGSWKKPDFVHIEWNKG
jgi:peptidoglycan L-alanyl-D-glutamate endopeptidase CwlK